jgi:hypothetical protein
MFQDHKKINFLDDASFQSGSKKFLQDNIYLNDYVYQMIIQHCTCNSTKKQYSTCNKNNYYIKVCIDYSV